MNEKKERILNCTKRLALDSQREMGVVEIPKWEEKKKVIELLSFSELPTDSILEMRAKDFADYCEELVDKYECDSVMVDCEAFFSPFIINEFEKRGLVYRFPLVRAVKEKIRGDGVVTTTSKLVCLGFYPNN